MGSESLWAVRQSVGNESLWAVMQSMWSVRWFMYVGCETVYMVSETIDVGLRQSVVREIVCGLCDSLWVREAVYVAIRQFMWQ